ncbi:MAG: 16S rRNA (adenine(1518)-N(6)/adenine(1519)-N(6))-dimethyltransferase RsmA [Patescibacteria group bacterium]|nr:16S rRNA (adenine(1518)-N(6)/adenine(1519)-N(6))-dimethyltransferase RsmA [Patescibacteria group bacterium]
MPQRLGQHFLHDSSVLGIITDTLAINPHNTIIEIGAGHGELTQELEIRNNALDNSLKIFVIEKDPSLVQHLAVLFSKNRNIEILEGDVRKILPEFISHRGIHEYKLAGNIPYYLTGFLLRIIGELRPLPKTTVLTIQKEVAERIAAEPPRMNRLAASIQFWATPHVICNVPRTSFSPPPKVDSSVLCLSQKNSPQNENVTLRYYAAVHALFAQPRKTLINNISNAIDLPRQSIISILEKESLDPTARPETLTISQIMSLASSFHFPDTPILRKKSAS